MLKEEQLNELILQSLEHERGGVMVYETAVKCAVDDDLIKEWEKYLEQTRSHVQILESVCEKFGLDPEQQTPGRLIVRHLGGALVEAMEMALEAGEAEAAQLVACECVVLAETKDHADWELLTKCAAKLTGDRKEALTEAADEVEDEEDEHLYHTKGWCRELWLDSLGLKAVIPPPEEKKHVKSVVAAARAQKESEQARERR